MAEKSGKFKRFSQAKYNETVQRYHTDLRSKSGEQIISGERFALEKSGALDNDAD